MIFVAAFIVGDRNDAMKGPFPIHTFDGVLREQELPF